MADNTATYLYCILRAGRRPRTTGVPPGVPGGTTPEILPVAGSLWMAAADVPLDMYGPGLLESRLRDLDWVSEVAVGHEGIVEHFARMASVTVVPMKLFTMFSSREKALSDIRHRRGMLGRVFRHIGGCEEWGIRVTAAPQAPAAPVGPGTEAAAVGRGAAFLAARKDARDAAKRARASAVAAARVAFDRLQRLARDAQVRDSVAAAGTNPPLLEAAFLVRAPARARFTAEARRQAAACARANADMTLTGPWPAYNFVDSGEGRS